MQLNLLPGMLCTTCFGPNVDLNVDFDFVDQERLLPGV